MCDNLITFVVSNPSPTKNKIREKKKIHSTTSNISSTSSTSSISSTSTISPNTPFTPFSPKTTFNFDKTTFQIDKIEKNDFKKKKSFAEIKPNEIDEQQYKEKDIIEQSEQQLEQQSEQQSQKIENGKKIKDTLIFMGLPQCIDNASKYKRNAFLFNIVLVFSAPNKIFLNCKKFSIFSKERNGLLFLFLFYF
jgi:hypothetical protein